MKTQFVSKYGIDFNHVESYDSPDGEQILLKNQQFFKNYEYKRDWDGTPVRVIRLQDGSTNYADYIKTKTATLCRQVNVLSVDDRYIDDLTEQEYYELCDFYIARKRFLEQVDESNCKSKYRLNKFFRFNESTIRARFHKNGEYVMQILKPNSTLLIEKLGLMVEIPSEQLRNELTEAEYYELSLSLMNMGKDLS
ncbi:hypothetical protein LV716_16735 [Flagellimonas sp. HMM57]|uniref:hypothetical protein n=1 Tax=unclassified Flagellimonas TaxID=2644544 RepID=UPI0013D42935|nr:MULTISPECIES: hypothetical protein [unclassified Flagellimonas]UII75889.1 hypothetical protein LV716_16735 [Flagellimonas sp. HMM57]